MAEQYYQQYKDEGYIMIVLLLDGYQEAVNGYVDYYGLTFPVLNDADYAASLSIGNSQLTTPYHVMVGRDMTVVHTGGSEPTETVMADALAAEWPAVDRPVQPSPEDVLEDLDDTATGNPFSAESVVTWDSGATCAVAHDGRTGTTAAALLALGIVLMLRRRR